LDSLIQCVTRFYISLLHTHTLMSTVMSSLPLLGSGFQRWAFPFLWVPELSQASAISFQQQQLTTTETQQLSDCQLVLLITSRHGPSRKHRSSVAVQLLLSYGITYSIFACASICTDCAENTIPLLLVTARCVVTAGSCDSTVLALSHNVHYC
jgi:hypothetical protein